MADARTPHDDAARPQPTGSGGVGRVLGSVLRTLGALARGADASAGAGGGVVEHDADHRTDGAAQRRRDYRP